MANCIFCKIIQGEIPTNLIYQDDKVVVFDDINPQAPIHKLIVPREHIETFNDITPQHNELMSHVMQIAKKIAQDSNVDQSGYRLIFNCNKDAGQIVFHLHMHLIGGKSLD